jgi:hypothetical protein
MFDKFDVGVWVVGSDCLFALLIIVVALPVTT